MVKEFEGFRCYCCGETYEKYDEAQSCCEPDPVSGFQCEGCGAVFTKESDAIECENGHSEGDSQNE